MGAAADKEQDSFRKHVGGNEAGAASACHGRPLRGRKGRCWYRHRRAQGCYGRGRGRRRGPRLDQHPDEEMGWRLQADHEGCSPIVMKDMGISLAGARDMMGKKNDAQAIANSAEMQALAKAENRLAAAKEDVHEAAAANSPVKRAQLEDLAQELTEEAAKQLDATKED